MKDSLEHQIEFAIQDLDEIAEKFDERAGKYIEDLDEVVSSLKKEVYILSILPGKACEYLDKLIKEVHDMTPRRCDQNLSAKLGELDIKIDQATLKLDRMINEMEEHNISRFKKTIIGFAFIVGLVAIVAGGSLIFNLPPWLVLTGQSSLPGA